MDTIWHTFWTYILFKRQKGVHLAVLGSIVPDIINLFAIGMNFLLAGFTWATYVAPTMPAWTLIVNYSMHSLVLIAVLGVILYGTARFLLPLCYGLGFHAVLDYLTHHSDAYPPFYPLSSWKFVSPFSYWEEGFYHHEVMILNLVLALAVMVYFFLTWKKSTSLERVIFTFGVLYFLMLSSFYALNTRSFELIVNGIIPFFLFLALLSRSFWKQHHRNL